MSLSPSVRRFTFEETYMGKGGYTNTRIRHFMKKLLSLPPNVVEYFHDITNKSKEEYFCTSDPVGRKLGSGGGTAWLLEAARENEAPQVEMSEWIGREKRVLLHAGGQSRRLPAYAPCGKVLTPVPVFRWARGQRINQNLLELQMPLYESILQKAPDGIHTLVASGDVLLRATEPLQEIPDADVVCYGLWADPVQSSHHGVFMMNRNRPDELDFMLQKPSPAEQAKLLPTHLSLMDIGVWLLSDRAVERLMRKASCRKGGAAKGSDGILCYDLYSEFGCALGLNPSAPDVEVSDLTVAVLPLPGGEFYHFGTGEDMLKSSLAIQNLVKDQRFIIQRGIKQQPSVFTQNCNLTNRPDESNQFIWIENSWLGAGWKLSSHNIVTGVPENDWSVELKDGICIDVVPVGESSFALRPYGYFDAFRGCLDDESTKYLGQPMTEWIKRHKLETADFGTMQDLQAAKLFPVIDDLRQAEALMNWIIAEQPTDNSLAEEWEKLPRLSADELGVKANLRRLFAQRRRFMNRNIKKLAANWQKSVFYQVNLKDMADKYAAASIALPEPLPAAAPLMTRIHDAMFRSETLREEGYAEKAAAESQKSFSLLREGMTQTVLQHRVQPRMTTCYDQIVWGRSPARIDLAGGWTDTPPYSLLSGGNVVNIAIEMNGQPPLQVYVKPCKEPVIICRSIDLGAMERIETYDQLRMYNKVGSPFSIPKAALTLAGFLPGFGVEDYADLRSQLEAFGCGIEITLLSAIPAGSGLGTSSILAATVLGALSDFCGLGWDKNEICNRTLVLEQLLTTGGGWQDQYGGVLHGVKLLQTTPGFIQNIVARWLPETVFTEPELKQCHLLYYTGLTRTAKNILSEIVRGMFLNNTTHLDLLAEMKQNALSVFDALQRGDFSRYGKLVRHTWEENKALDSGTNPPVVEELCRRIDDLCLGYKLPGAGGGGFMYMVAKDPQAAVEIRRRLLHNSLAPNARFVDMSLSETGLQISRS